MKRGEKRNYFFELPIELQVYILECIPRLRSKNEKTEDLPN